MTKKKKKEKVWTPPKQIKLSEYVGNKKLYLIQIAMKTAEFNKLDVDQIHWELSTSKLTDVITTFKKYFPDIKLTK